MENFSRSKEYWSVIKSSIVLLAVGVTLIDAQKTEIEGLKLKDLKLAPKHDYVVCSIEESKDVDELSLDKLQSSLLVHEQKINQSSTTDEQALQAFTLTQFSNSRGSGKDVIYLVIIDCYTKLPNNKEKGKKSNFIENKKVETLLMAFHVNKEPKSDVWYVDTGCCNHMCGSKSSFTCLNEDFNSKVSFGDFSIVKVMGKCDINIRTKNGFVETISNSFYVLDLKSNLLSTSQLQEKGYEIFIKKSACEIYDPSRGAIAVVQMSSNRLIPLKIRTFQPCLMVEIKDPSWLWHFRYGHLNFGRLKTLQ
ncbi:uncharacterized protein LOC114282602 [Camellia sinensis]|uniref:uncharacterized protein LOC114282602 n=1 Tax=Camellia sinensis TaxID=4442 RepID=UPI00103561FF|nr:uncharacterized protein LOC114282602 [Camellia sinensis]